MPPKRTDANSPSSSSRGAKRLRPREHPPDVQTAALPPPNTMATQVQTSLPALTPPPQRSGRITLPLPFHPTNSAVSAGPTSIPIPTLHQAFSPGLQGQGNYASPSSPYTPSNHRAPWGYFPLQDRPIEGPALSFSPTPNLNLPPVGSMQQSNLRKRSHDEIQAGPLHGVPQPLRLLTPSSIESRDTALRNILPPLSAHGSTSNVSTPTGTTTSFPPVGSSYSRQQSEASSSAMASRCSLHIRQQPRAARAGPDGKDRRNIDPPPVLQLMMADFDPTSKADIDELRSNFYVVHCKLVSAQSPRKDVSTQMSVGEDGSKEINRLLLGTLVSSPFFCADDPDPVNMPQHPTSQTSAPPSPSSRFFQTSSRKSPEPAPESESDPSNTRSPNASPRTSTPPGSFFIFADLSVRRAGEYRLEFTLMKISPSAMQPGNVLPMLHTITSSVFKVVNAKDFDQVHPSTELVKGLLARGAGFPLKLKKGIREGQRRKGGDTGEDAASEGGDGSMEGDRDAGEEEGEEEEAEQ